MQIKQVLSNVFSTDRIWKPETQRIIQRLILYSFFCIITLSILNVFSFPFGIKPKTSIGWLNLFTVFYAALIYLFQFPRPKRIVPDRKAIDYVVLFYYIANVVSLLVAHQISDDTNIRLLTSAVLFYFSLRNWCPTDTQKSFLLHATGIITLCTACFTVMQITFPSVLNMFASTYLQGREAYGLTVEFNRGRLFHWGSIILTFPFFLTSSFIIRLKTTAEEWAYKYLGAGILIFVMIVSNFRWIFIVFIFVSLLVLKMSIKEKILYVKNMRTTAICISSAIVIGLLLAQQVLGYNLVDRFLLKEHQRDVAEGLGRIDLYNTAINVFYSSPIVGSGLGNYYSLVDPHQMNRYFSIFDQYSIFLVPIANEMLTNLAESGIFGFLTYMFIVSLTLSQLIRLLRPQSTGAANTPLLYALFGSYVAFILYTLFENIFPQNYVYIFFISAASYTWFEKHTLGKGRIGAHENVSTG
jgi:O-antigen ligase